MSIKISELPQATSVGSSDIVPIVQGGTTKQATAGMISPTIDYTALEDITDNYQVELDTGNLTNPAWVVKKIWKYGDFMLIDFRVSFASRTSPYNNTPMAKIYGIAEGLQGNWFGSGRVSGDNYQRPASFIFFWNVDHYAVWGYNNGAEAITGAQASIIIPYMPSTTATRSLNLTKSANIEEETKTIEQPLEKEAEKTTLQNEGSGDSK